MCEPSTLGKVLLKTNIGDLHIELFSQQCPIACRNFIQLCMEHYYDNTIFHRLIKNFMVQVGDPTGTGYGGRSIYGIPFKNEYHSRLKFTRHGIIAMAGGQGKNNSQFFITLGPCNWLNKKYTIFAKITGDTIYNIFHFNKLKVDVKDKPLINKRILSSKILVNPFPDIIPRNKREKIKLIKIKKKINPIFLTFGGETENVEKELMKKSKIIIKSNYYVEFNEEIHLKEKNILRLKKKSLKKLKKKITLNKVFNENKCKKKKITTEKIKIIKIKETNYLEKLQTFYKKKIARKIKNLQQNNTPIEEIWRDINEKRNNISPLPENNKILNNERVEEFSESFDPNWFIKQVKFQKRPQEFKRFRNNDYFVEDTRKIGKKNVKEKTNINYEIRSRKLRLK